MAWDNEFNYPVNEMPVADSGNYFIQYSNTLLNMYVYSENQLIQWFQIAYDFFFQYYAILSLVENRNGFLITWKSNMVS